jgi:hypothetical protein
VDISSDLVLGSARKEIEKAIAASHIFDGWSFVAIRRARSAAFFSG